MRVIVSTKNTSLNPRLGPVGRTLEREQQTREAFNLTMRSSSKSNTCQVSSIPDFLSSIFILSDYSI